MSAANLRVVIRGRVHLLCCSSLAGFRCPQVIFGGWNGRQGLNDVHVLDLTSLEWSSPAISGKAPSPRNNHAAFVVGHRLFVHGGHDGSRWLADMYVLDTDKWEWGVPAVSGVPPLARACHTCSVVSRKVYLFGGYDGSRCFRDVDVLDLDTMTWIQPRVHGTPPQARNAQSMTVLGNLLVMYGGHSGQKHLRDLHVLDTSTMTWSQPEVTGHAPPGLRGHSATLVGHKIYLFGGYDGRGRSSDLYVLDTNEWTWQHHAPTDSTPTGRQRHTACPIGSQQVLISGGFDGYRWLADMHILDVGAIERAAFQSVATHGVLQDLRTMVNSADSFPDVTFLVEDRPVYAHRGILAARSEHFRAMFSSGMRESRESEIPIPDWSYDAFVAMLEYLYTGAIGDVAMTTSLELIGLADHSTVDGLKSLCEMSLVHSIDRENVADIFSAAHRFNASHLRQRCVDFIMSCQGDISGILEALSSEPALLVEITQESMRRRTDVHSCKSASSGAPSASPPHLSSPLGGVGVPLCGQPRVCAPGRCPDRVLCGWLAAQ